MTDYSTLYVSEKLKKFHGITADMERKLGFEINVNHHLTWVYLFLFTVCLCVFFNLQLLLLLK